VYTSKCKSCGCSNDGVLFICRNCGINSTNNLVWSYVSLKNISDNTEQLFKNDHIYEIKNIEEVTVYNDIKENK